MSAWTTAVAAAPTSQLWWRLGEPSGTTLADASGAGHPGTLSGATIGYGQPGPLVGDTDTAMSFTGTNPVGQAAYGAWADATVFSVLVWFKALTLAAANVLVARDHQAGGRRFQVQLTSAGALSFILLNSVGGSYAANTPASYGTGWHMATATYDQALTTTNRMKVYVDGSATAVATNGGANPISSSGTAVPFSVGNATRTTQSPANSTLDEVLYWPGVALTGAQHLALYQAGALGTVAQAVGWGMTMT